LVNRAGIDYKGIMPEKPKEEKDIQNKINEIGDDSSWSKDQQEKKYYYDDETGYEVYNPEEEENDELEMMNDE
jgi:hypothetical protein